MVWGLADGVVGGRAAASLEEGGVDRKAGVAAWREE